MGDDVQVTEGSSVSPNQVVRQPNWMRWISGAFSIGFLVLASLCVVGLVSTSGQDRVLLVLLLACSAYLSFTTLRLVLSWVLLTDSTLEVYNWPVHHEIAWSNVLQTPARRRGSIAVKRQNGRRIDIRALSGNPRYDLSWRDATVAEIRARSAA